MNNIIAMPLAIDDGLEEGEIVSDDLEAISDDSLVSTPLDVAEIQRPGPSKRKRTQRRHKKSSRRCNVNSDSSNTCSNFLRNSLKHQLKAAIHIESEDAHRNSLKTRLRGMVSNNSTSESDSGEKMLAVRETTPVDVSSVIIISSDSPSTCNEVQEVHQEVTPENRKNKIAQAEQVNDNRNSIAEEVKENDEIDNELIQLRLDALKTALNSKFGNRLRKKKKSQTIDETNKENSSNNSENTSGEEKITETGIDPTQNSTAAGHESGNVPVSPEEDEDVLRALLLASMSKKIINETPKLTSTEKLPKKLQQQTNKNLLKKINVFKLNNNFTVQNKFNKVVNPEIAVTKPFVKPSVMIPRVAPQVKPLIIRVNSDSDSDLDIGSNSEKSPVKKQSPQLVIQSTHLQEQIDSSVDKFLREQRQMAENKLSRNKQKKIEIAKISEHNRTIIKPVIRKALNGKGHVQIVQSIKSSIVTPKPQTGPKLNDLEKSALKFLPANKREEYKKLQNLIKLKHAQLKTKKNSQNTSYLGADLRGLAFKSGNIKKGSTSDLNLGVVNVTKTNKTKNLPINSLNSKLNNGLNSAIKKTPAVSSINVKSRVVSSLKTQPKIWHTQSTQTIDTHQVQLPLKYETRIKEFQHQELIAAEREQEKWKESELRDILKQIQTIKDGRLQIQERYKCFRPLVKKLNEVSKQQKHWDNEVERLMSLLAGARDQQNQLHKSMISLVKELAEEKEKLDSSSVIDNPVPKPTHAFVTSTPVKPPPIVSNSPSSSTSVPFETLLRHVTLPSNQTVNDLKINWQHNTTDDGGCEEAESSIIGSNNINKFLETNEEGMAWLAKNTDLCNRKLDKVKYVSPLDFTRRRQGLDPFGIMCPFQVNGRCKDAGCTYNHLPK
ncbi:girdin isoform X2 [Euwallacea fornicatus]|uniref:girdin isoform X2 n=1 Tax=Euwallacea fornicatus TaxID=995702 RepID=UPI00338FED8B